MKTSGALLASVFLLALGACGDDSTADAGGPDAMGTPDGNGLPAVQATLGASEVMAGDPMMITIAVQNFMLVDPATNTTDVAGEGHYRVYFDNDNMGDYLDEDFTPTVTVNIPADAPVGSHTLRVELVTNTGMMLDPQTSTPPISFAVVE